MLHLVSNSSALPCAPDENGLSIAFGTILFVGIGCSYISQHVKLLFTRSTEGVSWMMLFVANLSNWCASLNVVLLSSISCCVLPDTTAENCYELFLPILQIGMPSLNLLPIFIMFLCFQTVQKKETTRHQGTGRLARLVAWVDEREVLFARASFLVFFVVFVCGLSTVGGVRK
jgi:hypothetical protein